VYCSTAALVLALVVTYKAIAITNDRRLPFLLTSPGEEVRREAPRCFVKLECPRLRELPGQLQISVCCAHGYVALHDQLPLASWLHVLVNSIRIRILVPFKAAALESRHS